MASKRSGLVSARSILPVLAVALALAPLTGCRRLLSRLPIAGKFVGERTAPEKGPIQFRLKADQATYRIGDRVAAEVALCNLSRKNLKVQFPDALSIEFYLAGPGDTDPVRINPVFSRKEPLGQVGVLDGGTTWGRTFVFTTATQKPGQYRLIGIYHPLPKGVVTDLVPVTSNPIFFTVSNQVACRRDRDGILLKEDAIAIAKRYLGRPTTDAVALLVENDAGFLDWWVTLTIDPRQLRPGEESRQAFFVNPYLATIVRNRKARPYILPAGDRPTTAPTLTPSLPPPRP